MQAFISYSHSDDLMLEMLIKHLSQLQREGTVSTWTDNEIDAGGKLESNIFTALEKSKLFIALLSPNYLASNYCYEKEFQTALERYKKNELIIVPVIVEPCDWLSTPFREMKALPKDGKPISTWENKHTAFLDVIQNIRKLIHGTDATPSKSIIRGSKPLLSRDYRIKKDFDSIEKQEFLESSFNEVKEALKRYINEVIQLDNIKARVTKDSRKDFECILINRNIIADNESQLVITINSEGTGFGFHRNSQQVITSSISKSNRPSIKSFSLSNDEYHMFWTESNFYSHTSKELTIREVSDAIWNEWLESVGIM